MDPRIGTLKLYVYTMISSANGVSFDSKEIPTELLDQSKNEVILEHFSSLNSLEGLYTAIDPSRLELLGTRSLNTRTSINIELDLCKMSES